MKNLVLCGFMGSGKTTAGRLLAQKCSMELVDTDEMIEQQAGMKITQIFDQFGEEHFRGLERQVCAQLAERSGLIIATGGGALTFTQNVQALSKTGIIVFLDVSPDVVIERLQGDTTRPLLNGDKEAAIRELLAKRRPIYQSAADIVVKSDRSPSEIAEEIVERYKFALKR